MAYRAHSTRKTTGQHAWNCSAIVCYWVIPDPLVLCRVGACACPRTLTPACPKHQSRLSPLAPHNNDVFIFVYVHVLYLRCRGGSETLVLRCDPLQCPLSPLVLPSASSKSDPVVHFPHLMRCVVLCYPPPPLYKLRPCPSHSRRRDCNNCVRNFNYVQDVVRPHKTWVCRHVCQLHGAMDTFVSLCPLQPTWLCIWEHLCFIFPFLASAHHAIFSF